MDALDFYRAGEFASFYIISQMTKDFHKNAPGCLKVHQFRYYLIYRKTKTNQNLENLAHPTQPPHRRKKNE